MDDIGWTKVKWGRLKDQKSPATRSHSSAASNPFAVLVTVPPTDLFDLADRLEAGVKEWIRNDDVLLQILLHVFEANWFKARACLTMDSWPSCIREPPSHALSILLMRAMVDMRGRKWDAFAKKALSKFQNEVGQAAAAATRRFNLLDISPADSNEKQLNFVSFNDDQGLSIGRALGCQCVTSDIDLPLKGNNTEIGIGLINNAFREEFCVPFEPGTVFDINVYCIDWMHGQTEINRDVNSAVATFKPEPERRGVVTAEESEARADILEMWSLVKIRRNITSPEQWDTYEQTILATLKDEGARNSMKKKLIEAEFEYQSFRVRLQTQLQAMEATLRYQEAQLGYREEHSMFGHVNEGYAREAREMRASNVLYQETALQARELRARLDILRASHPENSKEISRLAKQLAFKIAEGLTYANEVYATEGAVLHTVYGKQEAKRRVAELRAEGRKNLTAVQFQLTQEHYLQSLNENVGDVLHALNRFQRQPEYAVYRAGKYMERLCEAGESLLSEGVYATLPSCGLLKEIARQSVRAKAEDVGADPQAVFSHPYFRAFRSSALLPSLVLQVLRFGATASALSRNRYFTARF